VLQRFERNHNSRRTGLPHVEASMHQNDLFKRFCKPGSDPVEAWVERVIADRLLSPTTKAVAYYFAHRAMVEGDTIEIRPEFYVAIGLNPRAVSHTARLNDALLRLKDEGYLAFNFGNPIPNMNCAPIRSVFLILNGGRL
jgi:hypothetical protein